MKTTISIVSMALAFIGGAAIVLGVIVWDLVFFLIGLAALLNSFAWSEVRHSLKVVEEFQREHK